MKQVQLQGNPVVQKLQMQSRINSLTEMYNMHKIRSIHLFVVEIKKILDPQLLKGCTHFWPHPPKYWINFLHSWTCISMQKISSFNQLILEIQPILESHDQSGDFHVWPYTNKSFNQIFLTNLLIRTNMCQAILHFFLEI